uniref:Uncharacterized protein n=1 Tax=Pinguiococcus pyrenoidosus TaxID=172671 RepID=A0A7R9U6W9_9STRA
MPKDASESFADDEGRTSLHDDRDDEERFSSEVDVSDSELGKKLQASQLRRGSRGRRRRADRRMRKGIGALSDEDIVMGRRPPKSRLRTKSKATSSLMSGHVRAPFFQKAQRSSHG